MQPTSFSVAAAATILVLCLAADGAPEPGRAGRLGARLRLRYRMQRGQKRENNSKGSGGSGQTGFYTTRFGKRAAEEAYPPVMMPPPRPDLPEDDDAEEEPNADYSSDFEELRPIEAMSSADPLIIRHLKFFLRSRKNRARQNSYFRLQ